MRYVVLSEVLEDHTKALEDFGGGSGLRDYNLLASAIAQPKATFGGQDLYPTLAEKAATLCFSLVLNHPFIDGNKRTGYLSMTRFLSLNGYDFVYNIDEIETELNNLAAGQISREDFTIWVEKHLVKRAI